MAGHVDGQETFRSAMAREAREEAGLDISVGQLQLCHTMHRLSDTERLSLFFDLAGCTQTPMNVEPHKCGGLDWFELDALPKNTVPYVEAALHLIAKGNSYSEFGWP